MMLLKRCQHRVALFETYRVATALYSDLAKQLRGALAADYTFVHERAELARQKMIAARDCLNIHLAEHGCLKEA